MDIGASFNRAFEIFTKNPVPFLAGFGVLSIVPIVFSFVPFVGLLVMLAWPFVVVPMVFGGIALVCGKSLSGVPTDVYDLLVPFQQRPLDYVIVWLAMISGAILCGVGALATTFIFMFAPLMVAEGADYATALSRSKDMVLANLNECLVMFLIFCILMVLGHIVVIGVLVTGPIAMLMTTELYIELKRKAYGQTTAPV